ncbi:MAG: hypothetical protein R3E02_06705 [Blastomonas sp.]
MKFDMSRAWNEAMQLLRSNQALILPVAGVFLFLPSALLGYLLPQPAIDGEAGFESMIAVLTEWFSANSGWFILVGIAALIGQLGVLALLLRRDGGVSVGDALKAALVALIPAFLANMLTSIVTSIGFLLLIVPGLYLIGRFWLVPSAIIAERIGNPLAAIQRSWELTRDNGWRLFGFLILVSIVGGIITGLTNGVFGAIFGFVLPINAALLLSALVESALGAVLALVIAAMAAASYLQLSNAPPSGLSQTFE